MRRLRRAGCRKDRGAAAVVIALCIVMLMGFVAIAIDLGVAWVDKKQLQNGADAGALALAQACAAATAECPAGTGPNATARNLAQANRVDGIADGQVIDKTATSVTVETAYTRSHWFAPLIGISETPVSARAKAVWGTPGRATSFPLTFSLCEFYWQTGTKVGAPSPSTTVRFEVALQTKVAPSADYGDLGTCGTRAAHNEEAGGFGWLPPNSSCMAEIDVNGWYAARTGASTPTCFDGTKLRDAKILIPIFDKTNELPGKNTDYHIYSFAEFQVADFCIGPNASDAWPAANSCPTSKRYIGGYFVKWVSLEDAMISGTAPGLGGMVVKLEWIK